MSADPTRHHARLARWMDHRGMRFAREERQREDGSVTTGYRLAPGGEARGRVVFVHGTGNEALYPHIGLFKILLSSGFEVYATDLDGHGRGGTGVFSAEGVRSAVPQMLARARRAAPGPVHAVGESLGASLLLGALADGSPGLASVVAISPPLSVRVTPAIVLREIGGIARTSLRDMRRHYGPVGMIPAFGPFRRSAFPIRTEARGALGYLDEVRRAIEALDLPDRLVGVRVPVLLIAGANDRVADPDDPARLQRALPASELRILPGRAHIATSVDPRTRAAALGWIARHCAAR